MSEALAVGSPSETTSDRRGLDPFHGLLYAVIERLMPLFAGAGRGQDYARFAAGEAIAAFFPHGRGDYTNIGRILALSLSSISAAAQAAAGDLGVRDQLAFLARAQSLSKAADQTEKMMAARRDRDLASGIAGQPGGIIGRSASDPNLYPPLACEDSQAAPNRSRAARPPSAADPEPARPARRPPAEAVPASAGNTDRPDSTPTPAADAPSPAPVPLDEAVQAEAGALAGAAAPTLTAQPEPAVRPPVRTSPVAAPAARHHPGPSRSAAGRLPAGQATGPGGLHPDSLLLINAMREALTSGGPPPELDQLLASLNLPAAPAYPSAGRR